MNSKDLGQLLLYTLPHGPVTVRGSAEFRVVWMSNPVEIRIIPKEKPRTKKTRKP